MEKFGKYQLVRRVGTGGMAEVYLARSAVAQGLAKQLVIKKIHPAFAKSHQFQAMFVDEAKIALGLNHPSIVQVFDFGSVGGTFFLAMEYVEGLDLLRLMQEVARRGERIPFGLGAYVVQQVAKALDYAHRKLDEYGEPLGIVHRDVSPQNVLVSWDGAVKIVDFGIARARHVHEEEGVIKGKFAYMSPEQARGEQVDARSDVFAAGVMLFELACGRPLFPGKGKEVLEKVRSGGIPRPRDVAPDIPEDLEGTILRALAYHRDDRFQTARDLQNELGRFLFRHADADVGPIDSSRLARFVAKVVPVEKRGPVAPPPTAARRTPAPLDNGNGADTPPPITPAPRPAEIRERKHVFVVEGRVSGATARSRAVLQDFAQVARDIAYKHDAHVHSMDREGFTMLVGLPLAAEDDAARTIRLALALIDALDAIGLDIEPELRLSVGVQRGVATLRRRGGSRFAYELSASTTALASRLASIAHPAEVLVGGGVFRIARDDFNFEELSSIEVTHDTEPPGQYSSMSGSMANAVESDTASGTHQAKVYVLRGPKERAQRMREREEGAAAELIGRELELKAMRDAYRDVLLTGRKRHLAILGESGVGKRSLVSAFLAGVPPEEAIVVRAAARAATSYTPYAIIADLARDLLGLAEGAESREVRRRMEMVAAALYPGEQQRREVRGLVQAIGMLMGARYDGDDGPDIDAQERKQRLLEALKRVEQRLQPDKPLIVVGEDVHWADRESTELFLELLKVDTQRPILGIVTGRPEPVVTESAADSGADIIALEELGPEASRAIVARRFAPDEDAAELADKIVARAGGNPFFVNEMLEALIERGILVVDEAAGGALRWVQRGAAIQVPTRIEALVATRIDLLEPALKETLMHAAVLGRAFAEPQVDELLGRSARADLAALMQRGLIATGHGAPGSSASYAFRNDMTMTVAYLLLPEEERRRLHQVAARGIQSAAGYRAGQDDAVIARHLELAGDNVAAADRYRAAAAHALQVGGNVDALRQLTRALKLLPAAAHADRFECHLQREEILSNLARRGEQEAELERLHAEARATGEPRNLALAEARRTEYLIDTGKAPAAMRAVAGALQAARDAGDELAEADALRLQAMIARLVGNNDEALQLCNRALQLCGEDRGSLLQRAAVLNVRGTALWHAARLHEAIEAYAEALVIYRMLKRPRYEARVLNNMGIVFAELGEFEEALAHYKSSLKIDQELGDRASLPLKLGNIGQMYNDLGDGDQGERYLRKALRLAEHAGDRRSQTDVVISLGQVFAGRGDHDRALELFERGLALATDNRDRYQEIRALIYMSLSELQTGRDPEDVLVLARNAVRLSRKMPMPVGEIFGLAAQAQALAQLGRLDEAVESSEEAIALQNESNQSEGAEQILHIHAQMCERAGKLHDARGAIQRAYDEIQAKAGRLRSDELRKTYLESPAAAAIARDHARLCQ